MVIGKFTIDLKEERRKESIIGDKESKFGFCIMNAKICMLFDFGMFELIIFGKQLQK